jgi:ATPase subunit of ABC transporter with duplicated ATPase domains
MSLVRLIGVTKKCEQKPVLRDASLRVDEGERLGLIGKNGVGKTTVLKLILRREQPDEGRIEMMDGLRIGYFSQLSELADEKTIVEVLTELFQPIHEIERELAELDRALATETNKRAQTKALARQGELMQEMDRLRGWTYPNDIETVLMRLGFDESHRSRPLSQLSGGWRNRAALAKILLEDTDLLLMDEPTNYLDIEGVAWLEAWLKKMRGAAVVVSHDRDFLDHVADRIVEIENHRFQEYRGDYTYYVREKPMRLKTLQREFEHEEELLAFESEGITERREMAADPSRALQRKLANIKKRAEPRPVDRIITALYGDLRAPDLVCEVRQIAKRYGDRPIVNELSFVVNRGDRMGVVGPNGCGKTTLMRILTGAEPPDSGKVIWRAELPFCDFNAVLAGLDPNDTVTHSVNVVKLAFRAPRKTVNRFLGLMQFSEMDLKQHIGDLSAGQKARVALAQCLLSGAVTLLLDEPTNHLDITSTQVMERALANFPGAVIVVSHDRFFLDKIATRLLVFRGAGKVDAKDGNWTTVVSG